MNQDDKNGFDISYYLLLTIGAFFAILNTFRWFRRDKEIRLLKKENFELKNIIIGKDDIIRTQKKKLDEYDSKRRISIK